MEKSNKYIASLFRENHKNNQMKRDKNISTCGKTYNVIVEMILRSGNRKIQYYIQRHKKS